MATAAERERLSELAREARTAATWVSGPRKAKLTSLADELETFGTDSEPARASGSRPRIGTPRTVAQAEEPTEPEEPEEGERVEVSK